MTDAPPRILYVDDDEALGRLTQKTLGRSGFDVVTATGCDDALARLRSEGFDAVALDHHMPGRDGLATLALIAELPSPPPVVYATGSDEGRIAVAALKAGAADYVIKDTGGSYFELLAEALRGAIDAARVRRAKAAADAGLQRSGGLARGRLVADPARRDRLGRRLEDQRREEPRLLVRPHDRPHVPPREGQRPALRVDELDLVVRRRDDAADELLAALQDEPVARARVRRGVNEA